MVMSMPKTINGHTFSTFNDLWNNPDFLSQEEKSEIEFNIEVKRVILEGRESMGITQKELAALANMTQPEIARLENEMNNPKVSTLLKVLAPLGYRLTLTTLPTSPS